jgi:hypothetical protein
MRKIKQKQKQSQSTNINIKIGDIRRKRKRPTKSKTQKQSIATSAAVPERVRVVTQLVNAPAAPSSTPNLNTQSKQSDLFELLRKQLQLGEMSGTQKLSEIAEPVTRLVRPDIAETARPVTPPPLNLDDQQMYATAAPLSQYAGSEAASSSSSLGMAASLPTVENESGSEDEVKTIWGTIQNGKLKMLAETFGIAKSKGGKVKPAQQLYDDIITKNPSIISTFMDAYATFSKAGAEPALGTRKDKILAKMRELNPKLFT